MLQFGWTQEPISTCVIKVLADHNGRKINMRMILARRREEKRRCPWLSQCKNSTYTYTSLLKCPKPNKGEGD
jgi:hypothetical protein